LNPKSIIIARTDSIGDVVLTLPLCGVLKQQFPGCRIHFLARSYTQAIIRACAHVDNCMDWDRIREGSPASQIAAFRDTKADVIIHVFPRKEILWIAKRAGIQVRIATGGRLSTITKCNKLVFFSRKKSSLHEAQLNLKLLRPLGIEVDYSLAQLQQLYGFGRVITEARKNVKTFLAGFDNKRTRVILHPLSKGSAAEWALESYQALIELLPEEKFEVFITGTKEEGERIRLLYPLQGTHVHDVTGKFSLDELIAFIAECDALIAASTGPLHIAAALGKKAVGLYSPRRPIHAGRWSPVGSDVHILVAPVHPVGEEKLAIKPAEVLQVLDPSS
jgi:heptosyltransferase III